jgi:hypothetical protein
MNYYPYLGDATSDLSQFKKPWFVERPKVMLQKLEIIPIRAQFVVADKFELNPDVVKLTQKVLLEMQRTISKCKPIFK